MNLKNFYSILLLKICFCTLGFSQNVKTVNSIPSPNATSLGTYGEIPVSLFTGTPQISIPLYELSSGNIKVPISLSYHSSGVRPDVHPGWVGMNMNLLSGGMITRIVKGVPDETAWEQHAQFLDSYNSKFKIGGNVGYLYWTSKLQTSDWSTSTKVESLAKSQNWVDTEPDEFTFNLSNGYGGKFYLKEDGKIVVVTDPAVRVELEDTVYKVTYPDYLVSPAISNIDGYFTPSEIQIKGFKITTPDGIQYEFGLWNLDQPKIVNGVLVNADNFSIEASADFFGECYFGERYNSWYLKRIVDVNNQNEIKFYYEPGSVNIEGGGFMYTSVVSFTKNILLDKKSGSTTPNGIFKIFGPVSSSSTQIKKYYSGEIIYPLYLKKIESKDFTVDFTISPTTELEYNYSDVLSDLSLQSISAFSKSIHAITPRLAVTAYEDSPNVRYFLRGDIDLFSASNTVWSYYVSYAYDGLYCGNQSCSQVLEGVDLSKIRWHKLDKIEVKSKTNNEIIKSYRFTYSNSLADRLMLLSLREADKYGNLLSPYSFEYENYNSDYYPGTQKLPPYNSSKTDHWGFFNNVDTEAGLDFNNATTLTNYKSKREPVADHLYTGILNKITYPTSGFTQFVFEPHQYEMTVIRNKDTGAFSLRTEASPKTAGGLRIKEIRSSAGYGSPEIVKKYEYDDGILGGESQYYWPGYKGKLTSGSNYTADRFITSTLLPVSSNSSGSHIGYSRVIERLEGSGWTEFTYTNHNTNLDENFITTIDLEKRIYSPFTDKEFERGQLLETKVYNNNSTLVKREKNIYTANPALAGQYARAVATQQIEVLGGWTIEGTAYKVYTYPFNLSRKEVYTYHPDGLLSNANTVDLSFNSMNQVSEQRASQSNSMELINRYKYISDYSNQLALDACTNAYSACWTGCNAYSKLSEEYWACRESCTANLASCNNSANNPTNPYVRAILNMKKANRLGSVVEEQTIYKRSGVEKTVGGKLNLYTTFGTAIHPAKAIQLDATPPYTSEIFSTITQSNQLLLSENYGGNALLFNKYDQRGNLIQYKNENDVTVSYLYGYDNKYVTAEIINASIDDVIYTSFELDNQNFALDGVTGSKCRVGIYSTTLPYNIGTYIVSYWKKETGGNWTYFEEEHIKPNTNPYQVTIGATNVKVDEVRIYPKGAFVTTYTYAPGIGITSKTDSNNQTIYFQYDSYGRLISIKDNSGNIVSSYEYNLKK